MAQCLGPEYPDAQLRAKFAPAISKFSTRRTSWRRLGSVPSTRTLGGGRRQPEDAAPTREARRPSFRIRTIGQAVPVLRGRSLENPARYEPLRLVRMARWARTARPRHKPSWQGRSRRSRPVSGRLAAGTGLLLTRSPSIHDVRGRPLVPRHLSRKRLPPYDARWPGFQGWREHCAVA